MSVTLKHISPAERVHRFFAGLILCTSFIAISCRAHGFEEVVSRADVFHPIIARAAGRYRVETEMIKAMIMAESGYDADAVSKSGARGLMQLMPTTAKALGVKDCFDPEQNITAGVRYFQRLERSFNGSIILALAAYNAGPTRVKKCGGIPEFGSTRQYIMRVLLFYHIYKTLNR